MTAAVSALGLGGALLPGLSMASPDRIDGEAISGARPMGTVLAEPAVRPPGTAELVGRLRNTVLLNGEEIHDRLPTGVDEGHSDAIHVFERASGM